MSYQVGDAVRITATFIDVNGNQATPTAASFTWRRAGETAETTWSWPVDLEVSELAPGKLAVTLPLDKAGSGDWEYRWSSSGAGLQRVSSGKIRVQRPSLVTPP